MSGRGDNNKHGTSGQGASNQSNQPFIGTENEKKSYHGKHTGGQPSQPDPKSKSQSANRNRSLDGEKE